MVRRLLRAVAIALLFPGVIGACSSSEEGALLRRGSGTSGAADDDVTTPAGSAGANAEPGLAAAEPGAEPDEVGRPVMGKAVLIHPGKTDNAELVDTLPVGASADKAIRRVVMRLDAKQLPDLVAGDRLIAPAEVQATTRCDVGQVAPGCGYSPNVAAQLVLGGSPDGDSAGAPGSAAISKVATQTCTSAEHHCMFVFRPEGATLAIDGELPCLASKTCSVNLVMWAWHPEARPNGQDKVLVGGNDGDYLANGKVEGDIGRLMAIRERGIAEADREVRDAKGSGTMTVPTTAAPVLVYSHPLKEGNEGLAKGEQFVVEAKVVTAVGSRARFSTEVFLTTNPKATDAKKDLEVTPRSIAEQNGVNCLPGDPCVTQRVAVFQIDAAIEGPVYVNVVAKSAVPGGGAATVTVKKADGFVRSTRYGAELRR